MNLKQRVEADFQLLIRSGAAGFYERCEVTNIYLVEKQTRTIRNYYTLAVLEEASIPAQLSVFLTKKLLPIDENMSLGISRFYEDVPTICNRFTELLDVKPWIHNGKQLSLGALSPIAKQFVPSNTTYPVPINSVLKNNFDAGSYVIEFFNTEKSSLGMYAKDVQTIGRIGELIQRHLPIDLLYIADRIGNIVFQFPITLVAIRKQSLKNHDGIHLDIVWHPKLIPIPKIQILSSSTNDQEILGFRIANAEAQNGVDVETGDSNGEETSVIYNPDTQLILDMKSGYFIKEFTINMNLINASEEPRTFTSEQRDGSRKRETLVTLIQEHVQTGRKKDAIRTINDRIYEEKKKHLTKELSFVA